MLILVIIIICTLLKQHKILTAQSGKTTMFYIYKDLIKFIGQLQKLV